MENELGNLISFVMKNNSDNLGNETTSETLDKDGIVWFYLYGAAMCLITVAGAVENGTVIFVFHMNNKIHSTTNIFITFLCFCNFVISVIAILFTAVSYMLNRWLFGDFGCTIHGFVMTSFGISSIMILVAISFDRYIIIIKQAQSVHMRRKRYHYVAGCLLYGILSATPPLFGWNSYKEDEIMFSCSIDWRSKDLWNASYSISMFMMGFILPLITITIFYSQILNKIKYISRRSSLRSRQKIQLQREAKIVNTTLLILGAFIASWFPYSIYALWTHFGSTDQLPLMVHYIPLLMAKASVIWNPIIYTYKDKRFRKALFNTFPWLNCHLSMSENTKTAPIY